MRYTFFVFPQIVFNFIASIKDWCDFRCLLQTDNQRANTIKRRIEFYFLI